MHAHARREARAPTPLPPVPEPTGEGEDDAEPSTTSRSAVVALGFLLATIALLGAQLLSESLPLQRAIDANAVIAERVHLLLAGANTPPVAPLEGDTDRALGARLMVIERERAAGRLPSPEVLRTAIADLGAERAELVGRLDASRERLVILGAAAFAAAVVATIGLLHANRRRRVLHDQRLALLLGATHDPTTGIHNRSAILDTLCREAARGRRTATPVGVAVVEVALLDPSADAAECDAVLAESAHRLRAGVRLYDAVGRFDERRFLLVLPGCDAEDTRALAERLAGEVAAGADERGVRARVRAGVAAARAGEDPLDAVVRAAEFDD